jgi:hypothetical protein
MKRAISVLFAASAMCAVAAEPGKPAAPTIPGAEQLAPPALPESLLKRLDPDGSLQLRENPQRAIPIIRARTLGRPQVCYFIRTTQPVPAGEGASRKGFIPLQAYTARFVKQPDCTSDGALMRSVPAKLEIAAPKDGDSRGKD